MPTTSLRIPSVQSPPVPLHIAAVRLIPTALFLAATLSGFTGCAAVALSGPLAPGLALGAVVLGPLVAADLLLQTEREKTQKKWEKEFESELRPLLPSSEAATSPAPDLLRVRVDAHNSNYGKKIVVEAVGDFDRETAKRFAEGVRLIAWRCSDDVRLRLYTNREGPAGLSVKDSVSPEDYSTPSASPSTLGLMLGAPFRLMDGTPRGRRELARYEFHPSKAVAEELQPLLPRTALHRRTIFGPNSSGVCLKEGALQIVAWGDFSEDTARAFIDTSKSFFPDIAVAVYRDSTPNSKDWPLVARYDPGKAGQPIR